MQKSILILSIFSLTCNAMKNPLKRMSPAELFPADVISIIFCKLLAKQASIPLQELEQAKEKSLKAIAALRNSHLVCKRWYNVAKSPLITQHFLEHLTYDPQCALYTSKPQSRDFLSKLHSTTQFVIHNSLTPEIDRAALDYFLNHPTNDQLHNEIKRKIRQDGKMPFTKYEEVYNAYAYFEQQIGKTYQPLYAALNLNTPSSRVWALEHLRLHPKKASLIMVLACLFGKAKMVQELLDEGENPNGTSTDMRIPKPLHIAIAYNQADVVQTLLASPILKTDELDWNQECPLAKALHLSNPKIIRLLVDSERVDILSIPATSLRVPPVFRNDSNNASWYISQFCSFVDPETKDYIAHKVDERYRKSYGP